VADATHERRDVLRGILLMCTGVSLFPFMNAAMKLLAQDDPIVEIVWGDSPGI
jgi:hypothetical protein